MPAALGLIIASAIVSAQSVDPYQTWARVLAKHVNDRGQVDFRALAADRRDLDAFLGYVARVSRAWCQRRTRGAKPSSPTT